MSQITITLPDGSQTTAKAGVTPAEIAADIGPGLARAAIAAVVDDNPCDLDHRIESDASVRLLTWNDEEGREVYRHSTSHLMAQAVKRLFPDAKPAIGPPIEDGFYYDFDVARPFTEDDLAAIEEEMRRCAAEDLTVTREVLPRDQAVELFRERDEPYKVEILEEIEDGEVSIYRQGEFVDLCRGPHLPSTSRVKSFKLLSVAGAYWRGDVNRPMLQRIYGTSFPSQKLLDEHLQRLEEAKRRDHRRLGRELDLFRIEDESGPGLVLWHPNGALIRKLLEDFWRDEHEKRGYQLVFTPHLARAHLWEKSGHTDLYSEMMFPPMDIEGQQYRIKPMNCPLHARIYNAHIHSYRDLPIKYFELGTVYRYEPSGVLHGLMRVRGFTQDDSHIFCRPDQLAEVIGEVLDFAFFMFRTFGFEDFKMDLSTRPEKFAGDIDGWDRAEETLKRLLEEKGLPYEIDEGGGAFYGPKIDVKLRDSLRREWQMSTIQLDFNLPVRLGVEYIGEDGKPHHVYMVHRAMFGSMERFFGVLVEHFGGRFPVWLAPVQVALLPIADRHLPFSNELAQRFVDAGIRAQVDDRREKTSIKVAEAEAQQRPYILVVGDREQESGQLQVRARGRRNLGNMSAEELIERIAAQVSARELPAGADVS